MEVLIVPINYPLGKTSRANWENQICTWRIFRTFKTGFLFYYVFQVIHTRKFRHVFPLFWHGNSLTGLNFHCPRHCLKYLDETWFFFLCALYEHPRSHLLLPKFSFMKRPSNEVLAVIPLMHLEGMSSLAYRTKYSRMDQVEFVEDSL